jgi:cellulase
MKSSVFALALASGAQLAAAHTTVYNVLVNGKDQGLGNVAGGYIDSPPNNDPVKDVTSKDMTCNVAGIKAAKSVEVAGGDEITFEWHHSNADASDDIIASSHHGPIMVYASKAGSSLSWTKIAEDTYDASTKEWAVDKLIKGSYTGKPGQHKMTLPKLAPGEYVLRPEILALHEGNNIGGAQFYMECVHVKVGGSGTVQLPAGVAIPSTDAYKADDAGVHFNIYSGFTSYPGAGPKLWSGAAAGNSAAAPAPAASSAAAVTPAKPAATSAVAAAPSAAPAQTTFATVAKPAATGNASAATAQKYAQCGGQGFTGATACARGSTCTKQNDYYSQCI